VQLILATTKIDFAASMKGEFLTGKYEKTIKDTPQKINKSGQISIIPKPELRGFWERFPLLNHHLR